MKNYLFLLIALIMSCFTATGQESSLYLWEGLQPGKVNFKLGKPVDTNLTYHLGLNKFLFSDDINSNDPKILINVDDISSIIVLGRSFTFDSKGNAYELLLSSPILKVSYAGSMEQERVSGAYGIKSETAASTNINQLTSDLTNVNYNFNDDRQYILKNVRYTYSIIKDNKARTFSNEKQFIKLFDKSHRNEIIKYIKDNKVSFSSVEDVKKLVLFTETIM